MNCQRLLTRSLALAQACLWALFLFLETLEHRRTLDVVCQQ